MVAFENILVPPRGSPLKTWSIKQSSPVVPSYTRLVSAPQSHLQCFFFYFFFVYKDYKTAIWTDVGV